MGQFETTFNGILQILNDPVMGALRDEPLSIRPQLIDKTTSKNVAFEMVLTILPSGEQYTIFDYWENNGDVERIREMFFQKCILFLLFHQKNENKDKIYE